MFTAKVGDFEEVGGVVFKVPTTCELCGVVFKHGELVGIEVFRRSIQPHLEIGAFCDTCVRIANDLPWRR